MSLAFHWDPSKAVANESEIIIGHSHFGRLLLVVFAEQPIGTLRLISARRATPKEQRDYEYASRS